MNNNNIYKTIIAEDSLLDRELLVSLLSDKPYIRLCGTCDNGNKLGKLLSETVPELLFLDIELPGCSGIEALSSLPEKNRPLVIMTTSHTEYAATAFDIGTVDYIVKPVGMTRLNRALDRFIEKSYAQQVRKDQGEKSISFRNAGNLYRLSSTDIIFAVSCGKSTIIHTEQKDYTAPILLKELVEKMSGSTIHRIHREYAVNTDYIDYTRRKNKGSREIVLKDKQGSVLPEGRAYKNRTDGISE